MKLIIIICSFLSVSNSSCITGFVEFDLAKYKHCDFVGILYGSYYKNEFFTHINTINIAMLDFKFNMQEFRLDNNYNSTYITNVLVPLNILEDNFHLIKNLKLLEKKTPKYILKIIYTNFEHKYKIFLEKKYDITISGISHISNTYIPDETIKYYNIKDMKLYYNPSIFTQKFMYLKYK